MIRVLKTWMALQANRRSHPLIHDLVKGLAGHLQAGEMQLLAGIEEVRRRYLEDPTEIDIVDFGREHPAGRRLRRRIRDIVRISAISRNWGTILYRFVRVLKPRTVVELGTNLGISTAYILAALADRHNDSTLISLEGDPQLAERAGRELDGLGYRNYRLIEGPFHRMLPGVIGTPPPIDFVFIDGHHDDAAILSNLEMIRPALSPSSCVFLDDIVTSRGVRKAWRQLSGQTNGMIAYNAFRMGILVSEVNREKEL